MRKSARLCLAALLTSLLCSSIGAITYVTNLTLVPERINWNQARVACSQRGGQLVQVKDETKQNMVNEIWAKLRANLTRVRSIFIGLAAMSPNRTNYYWTETCEPLSWGHWSPDTEDSDSKQCSRLKIYGGRWLPTNCTAEKHYMCEQSNYETCPYETEIGVTLSPSGTGIMSVSGTCSLQNCRTCCDTRLSPDGAECWAFNFRSSEEHCNLFYTFNPVLVTDPSQWLSDRLDDLHIKRCYNGFLGETLNSTIPSGTESFSIDNCTVKTENTTTTRFPPIEDGSVECACSFSSSLVTTTTQSTAETLPTTSTRFFSSSQLYSKSKTTDITEIFLTSSTPAPSTNISESTPEGVTNTVNVTDTTIDTETSLSSLNVSEDFESSSTSKPCYCLCTKASNGEMGQFIKEVLSNLTINKTELSSVRRRQTSAPDDRPSATGIGFGGMVFLSLVFLLIIVADASTLVHSLHLNRRKLRQADSVIVLVPIKS